MQQKEFEVSIRQAVPATTGVDSITIENGESSKMNFHGIRYKGRIIQDILSSAQFGSGFISLMCIPNEQITLPTLLTEADLNDSNSFIIAVEAWQTHTRPSTGEDTSGYSKVYDFDIAPKTSRSCMRGGRIVGQITNNAPTATITVTHLLSTFETV